MFISNKVWPNSGAPAAVPAAHVPIQDACIPVDTCIIIGTETICSDSLQIFSVAFGLVAVCSLALASQ